MLKDKVRTQKIYCPSVQWGSEDLTSAFNRRVDVYSDGKVKTFEGIFSSQVEKSVTDGMLSLSNRNPRDLWHLSDRIFRAQYKIDPTETQIGPEAVKFGMDEFVREFNFYEYYPRKTNARANSMDIYAYIKHLLKLDSPEFTRNQLNDRAGTGSSTQNYVAAMESIGLVERTGTTSGSTTYCIRDPKVLHALEHKIDIDRNN